MGRKGRARIGMTAQNMNHVARLGLSKPKTSRAQDGSRCGTGRLDLTLSRLEPLEIPNSIHYAYNNGAMDNDRLLNEIND